MYTYLALKSVHKYSHALRDRNRFEIDEELPQKGIGGMKLDSLVYEKK